MAGTGHAKPVPGAARAYPGPLEARIARQAGDIAGARCIAGARYAYARDHGQEARGAAWVYGDRMVDLVLFHHVLGLTDGVHRFADQLRNRGHTVHTPDLFEGRTFATVEEGMGYAESLGLEQVIRRGIEAAGELPKQAVFGGFSIGVLPAQQLLQTTPEALGGLFLHSFVDPEFLPGSWPTNRPVQVHGMDHDPFFAGEGDLEAARAVQSEHPELEIVLHSGSGHLFTDSSTADYDESAAADVLARASTFLAGFDAGDRPTGAPAN